MQIEFNIRDFGTVGDGKTNDGPAIQKALDQCRQAGGGRVRIYNMTCRLLSPDARPCFIKENAGDLAMHHFDRDPLSSTVPAGF